MKKDIAIMYRVSIKTTTSGKTIMNRTAVYNKAAIRGQYDYCNLPKVYWTTDQIWLPPNLKWTSQNRWNLTSGVIHEWLAFISLPPRGENMKTMIFLRSKWKNNRCKRIDTQRNESNQSRRLYRSCWGPSLRYRMSWSKIRYKVHR